VADEYVCSRCRHGFTIETGAPAKCPSCGAPSGLLWAVNTAAKIARTKKKPRSVARTSTLQSHRRSRAALAYGIGLAVALIIVLRPTPIAEERWSVSSLAWTPQRVPHDDRATTDHKHSVGSVTGPSGPPIAESRDPTGSPRTSSSLSTATGSPPGAPSPPQEQPVNPTKPTPLPPSDQAAVPKIVAADASSDEPAAPELPRLENTRTKACLPASVDKLIYVVDVSVSMGLPSAMPIDLERQLDRAIDAGDETARTAYREWLARQETSRLDLAKTAITRSLSNLPAATSASVVSFHDCGDVRRVDAADASSRPRVAQGVNALAWRRGGDTALSEAVRAGYAAADGAAARMIIITDGQDSCGPPPCSIIANLARENPRLRIDVLDVSGHSHAACLTYATGGQFTVANVNDTPNLLATLVAQSSRACPQDTN